MMYADDLKQTAQALVASGKGILAIDESVGTCNARFGKLGIAQTEEQRRAYRELLLSAPGIGQYISGAILFDETLRQRSALGKPFIDVMRDNGILPGIKVDTGTHSLAGSPREKVTEGLDRLRERAEEYRALGARFAKWRAVMTIDVQEKLPSQVCVDANSHALARYAAVCQNAGLVPIIEPEVLMDGDHSIDACFEATERVLHRVFVELYRHDVKLDAVVLKPNMVTPGAAAKHQAAINDVAQATLKCLLSAVPTAVAGIAFLSGGQDEQTASRHLNAINVLAAGKAPWPLTFSFGRALQGPALLEWSRCPDNVARAQKLLVHRAHCNSHASQGNYFADLEGSFALDLGVA